MAIDILDSEDTRGIQFVEYADLAAFDTATSAARPAVGDKIAVDIAGKLDLLDSSGVLSKIGAVAILRDEKATTTDGGSSSAATWNARDLNTEDYDGNNIVTIATNQFTPIDGTYILRASAPAYQTGNHRLRLYNVTGAAVVDEGQNARAGGASVANTPALLTTVFTANGTDAYRIDHYTVAAKATDGLGEAVGDGSSEVYMAIELQKIA